MSVRIRWFPPSWVQIMCRGTITYIDPAYLRTYYLNHPGHIEYSKWPGPIDGLPEQLPCADVILLTHHHKDHTKPLTVARLSTPATKVVGPQRCAKALEQAVDVVEPGERREIAGMSVNVVHSYNIKAQHPEGKKMNHSRGVGVGYVVEVDGVRVYHAGDSDFIPEMRHLGRIDVAFIPIDGKFTMPLEKAVELVKIISPRLVVPIHWMQTNPEPFVDRVNELGISTKLPHIGETVFKSNA